MFPLKHATNVTSPALLHRDSGTIRVSSEPNPVRNAWAIFLNFSSQTKMFVKLTSFIQNCVCTKLWRKTSGYYLTTGPLVSVTGILASSGFSSAHKLPRAFIELCDNAETRARTGWGRGGAITCSPCPQTLTKWGRVNYRAMPTLKKRWVYPYKDFVK